MKMSWVGDASALAAKQNATEPLGACEVTVAIHKKVWAETKLTCYPEENVRGSKADALGWWQLENIIPSLQSPQQVDVHLCNLHTVAEL